MNKTNVVGCVPEKKDTKTKNEVNKQKRFLNDTMKNLLIEFKRENPQYPALSLSTFCRYRPYWITATTAANQETCLCKTHVNFAFLVKKMKILKLIEENSVSQIINNVCCKDRKDTCMERNCKSCVKKDIVILDFEDMTEYVSYEMWMTKRFLL